MPIGTVVAAAAIAVAATVVLAPKAADNVQNAAGQAHEQVQKEAADQNAAEQQPQPYGSADQQQTQQKPEAPWLSA